MNNMRDQKIKKEKGFMLVELLVSVAIFTIIIFFSLGAVVIIFSSNRKSESIRVSVDNANFALEAMSRDIRFGENFQCGNPLQSNCSDGNVGHILAFISASASEGNTVFELVNGQIVKNVNNGGNLPLTAPTYKISTLNFTLVNNAGSSQPMVTIFIQGEASPNAKESSTFSLQTTVSPRQLNN